jgi:uncharacterized protein
MIGPSKTTQKLGRSSATHPSRAESHRPGRRGESRPAGGQDHGRAAGAGQLSIGPDTRALITGAGGGIGAEFAVQLAARGASLVLVARRAGKLDQLRTVVLDHHPALVIDVIAADLSEPGSAAEVARQIQLNAGSVADLTVRFLPPMLAAGHGLVINVASTAAFQPVPTMAVYAATMAFVLSFTEALWQEIQGSGIRVLALCPGATETGFFAAAAAQPFMTRSRQTPQQVVRTALSAIGKTYPPSCPGA